MRKTPVAIVIKIESEEKRLRYKLRKAILGSPWKLFERCLHHVRSSLPIIPKKSMVTVTPTVKIIPWSSDDVRKTVRSRNIEIAGSRLSHQSNLLEAVTGESHTEPSWRRWRGWIALSLVSSGRQKRKLHEIPIPRAIPMLPL